jgi:putative ABC transport system permease protein
VVRCSLGSPSLWTVSSPGPAAAPIAGARFTVIGIIRQAAGSNAPDLYIPMARAQALAKLGGQVNIVYVRAASAAAVGAVTGEISRLLPRHG